MVVIVFLLKVIEHILYLEKNEKLYLNKLVKKLILNKKLQI